MAAQASPSRSGELQNPKEEGCILKPRQLNVVWGDNKSYWTYKDGEEYAELKETCWLEVTGSVKNLSKGKQYQVSFLIEMTDEPSRWKECPVYIMAKIGKKGAYTWKKIDFSKFSKGRKIEIPVEEKLIMRVPNDKKIKDTDLHFGLFEVWTGVWKRGLRIYEAQVRELEEQAVEHAVNRRVEHIDVSGTGQDVTITME